MNRPWDDSITHPRTVLVFSVAPLWSPHFETELEIISGHHGAADVVHVATCDRELVSCLANPRYHLYGCMNCRSTARRGLDLVGVPDANRHHLGIDPKADLGLPEFATIDDVRAFTVDGVAVGAAAASSLISLARDSAPDLAPWATTVKDLATMAVELSRAARRLLNQLRPDLVYVFNGRYASTAPLIAAATSLGIPFVTHEASYEADAYRLIENSTIHDLATVKQAVADTWERSPLPVNERERIGREFFVGRRTGGSGDAVEEYQFARRQQRGELPDGMNEWRGRKVAIFTSSEDEFAVVDSYANPVYENQIDGLDRIARHAWPDDVRVVIREHPNLRGVDNHQTRRLRELGVVPNVVLIEAGSPADSYALAEAADVVVTFGSTMGAEAVFWERPSVLVGRAAFEDLGLVRPMTHNGVVEAILRPSPPSPSESVLPYGFFVRRWSIPFERYRPQTFRTGTFLGHRVRPDRMTKLGSTLLHLGVAVVDRDERTALTRRLRTKVQT